jgi:hypothetical protein
MGKLYLFHRIGMTLLGTPTARPAPEKVKLATYNGYGNNEAGPPRL